MAIRRAHNSVGGSSVVSGVFVLDHSHCVSDQRDAPESRAQGVSAQRRWKMTSRKAGIHAALTATVLWAFALVVAFSGTSYRSFAGPLKGGDFVHFYTIGYLARTGAGPTIYDPAALHQAQARLVPESADLFYPAVYPPQTALIFAPLSVWSYGTAALAWTCLTIVGYILVVWCAWRPVRATLPSPAFVIAVAAAFPPFWQLVLHGQTTIVVLAAFCLGWLALEKGRPFLAGLAFGLLGVKPQFAIPLAVIALLGRHWMMMSGALVSLTIQGLGAWAILGSSAFEGFAHMLQVVSTHADYLEPKPYQSHSLRAFMRILPELWRFPAWVAASSVVLWYTARVWTAAASLRARLSIVILAAVLVNPHLVVYDVTLLALPLMWAWAWISEHESELTTPYPFLVYGLFVTLLAPTASVIGVQVSVLIMTSLFVMFTRTVLASSATSPQLAGIGVVRYFSAARWADYPAGDELAAHGESR